MNTSRKGNIACAKLLATLVALGKTCLVPWGDTEKYDLAIEEDGKFLRVQCKMGRIEEGTLVFETGFKMRPDSANPNWTRCVYDGQADVFGVYCPENEKCYLVPVEGAPRAFCSLRLEKPKNNQQKGIRWAEQFEIGGLAQLGERLDGIEKVMGSSPIASTFGSIV